MTAEPRADPFQLDGTTIEGKYRVASVVGDGGFGVVYRGVHKGFGELIAIKCLKLPHELDEAAREALLEQLREEGRLLHRLSRATSGIVQALDVGAFTTPAGVWVPYLVLEWLEGQTLAELMRDRAQRGEGGMSLEETIRLLDPAARALAVAHAHKVAHRDVKPANLFVAEVGDKRTLKVLDFGIAKVLSSNASITTALEATKLGPTAFTPRYGAPEQFNKKRGASGPWTDVFALALIFVELVSGKKALDGDDPTELYIASADPTLRPTLRARGIDVPDAVEAVLHKALGVEPKQRYADAGAFWDALVAASGTTRGSQPSTPEVAAAGAQLAARAAGPAELAATMPVESMAHVTAARGSAAKGDDPGAAPPSVGEDSMVETPISARGRLPSLRLGGDESVEPAVRSEVPGAPRGERAPAARAPLWPWLLGAAPFLAAAAWGVSQLVPATPTSPVASGSGRPTTKPPVKAKPGPRPAPSSSASAAASSSAVPAAPPTAPEGMVFIAPAALRLGDGATARDAAVTRGFFIDRTEVTVRAYQVCMQKGGCSPANAVTPPAAGAAEPAGEDSPPADQFAEAWSRRCNEPQRFLDHPINCVDWSSADNYCRFVGRRLPTEAEWELAARGPAARVYAWGGAAPDCQRACYDKNQGCRPAGEDVATCAVMSRKGDVTTDGVFDLGGNVAEWVVDGFAPTPAGGDDPRGPEAAPLRVVKGAGFVDEAPRLHAAVRDGMAPAAAAARVGFRCAADVPVDAHTVPPER